MTISISRPNQFASPIDFSAHISLGKHCLPVDTNPTTTTTLPPCLAFDCVVYDIIKNSAPLDHCVSPRPENFDSTIKGVTFYKAPGSPFDGTVSDGVRFSTRLTLNNNGFVVKARFVRYGQVIPAFYTDGTIANAGDYYGASGGSGGGGVIALNVTFNGLQPNTAYDLSIDPLPRKNLPDQLISSFVGTFVTDTNGVLTLRENDQVAENAFMGWSYSNQDFESPGKAPDLSFQIMKNRTIVGHAYSIPGRFGEYLKGSDVKNDCWACDRTGTANVDLCDQIVDTTYSTIPTNRGYMTVQSGMRGFYYKTNTDSTSAIPSSGKGMPTSFEAGAWCKVFATPKSHNHRNSEGLLQPRFEDGDSEIFAWEIEKSCLLDKQSLLIMIHQYYSRGDITPPVPHVGYVTADRVNQLREMLIGIAPLSHSPPVSLSSLPGAEVQEGYFIISKPELVAPNGDLTVFIPSTRLYESDIQNVIDKRPDCYYPTDYTGKVYQSYNKFDLAYRTNRRSRRPINPDLDVSFAHTTFISAIPGYY